jgi:pimeloyl-ACP methyl ester carboxylesterase
MQGQQRILMSNNAKSDLPVLLIHGSCHGAWCWRDVLPELAARGLPARAIDLPGHGADPTPLADVTLDGYAAAIESAAMEMGGRVVLLGHSMAGYAISAAAVRNPAMIEKLIYLCAYLPVSGRSLTEMRQMGPRQPLLPAIRKTPDDLAFTFDPAMAQDLFYHDCPPGTLDYALAHLTPQAILPQATPLTLSADFERLEKHYIRCADDRAIPPEYQQTMRARLPENCQHDLPASHSPFFSMPERLADLLAGIARG